jgi:hypothetical protein
MLRSDLAMSQNCMGNHVELVAPPDAVSVIYLAGSRDRNRRPGLSAAGSGKAICKASRKESP